jgi:hypothetical protein
MPQKIFFGLCPQMCGKALPFQFAFAKSWRLRRPFQAQPDKPGSVSRKGRAFPHIGRQSRVMRYLFFKEHYCTVSGGGDFLSRQR